VHAGRLGNYRRFAAGAVTVLGVLSLALSLPPLARAQTAAKKSNKAAKPAPIGKPKRWGKCPADMVTIKGAYCIDRYEAYVAELLPGDKLRRHSVHEPLDRTKRYKALNRKGRMPQAYISKEQAEQACFNAGKRLCSDSEWVTACKGKKPTAWPYGDDHQPGRCNDAGVSHFIKLFGTDGREPPQSVYSWQNLNDPRLNQAKNTCAPAGAFGKCKNSFHVYDMVGNLHEWTAAAGGTFRGGYYLDVKKHGHGCDYKTTAHNPKYHDYSTGFRCCADL
jgi:formylglycine-generating enzyme